MNCSIWSRPVRDYDCQESWMQLGSTSLSSACQCEWASCTVCPFVCIGFRAPRLVCGAVCTPAHFIQSTVQRSKDPKGQPGPLLATVAPEIQYFSPSSQAQAQARARVRVRPRLVTGQLSTSTPTSRPSKWRGELLFAHKPRSIATQWPLLNGQCEQ